MKINSQLFCLFSLKAIGLHRTIHMKITFEFEFRFLLVESSFIMMFKLPSRGWIQIRFVRFKRMRPEYVQVHILENRLKYIVSFPLYLVLAIHIVHNLN